MVATLKVVTSIKQLGIIGSIASLLAGTLYQEIMILASKLSSSKSDSLNLNRVGKVIEGYLCLRFIDPSFN